MRAAEGLENDATFERRLRTAHAWIADLQSRMKTTPNLAFAY
jgi:hypothetical protein